MREVSGSMDEARGQGISVSIEHVSKRYGSVSALDDVSINIGQGEFLTLLGPSGSGKTSLLMALAGFLDLDDGQIIAGDRRIDGLPPEKRQFGMVFQGYALFPHLTVAENIAFPLKVRRMARAEIEDRVSRVLDLVQLSAQKDRLPKQLSGGQQQRTALARAIVFEPGLLLLDEPLSALDKALREELQWEMKSFHRRVGVTFVYVTHDQGEALGLSDRIGVMRAGKLVQVDTPKLLYDRPRTKFVAGFLGTANFIAGTVVEVADEQVIVETHGLRFTQATERRCALGEQVVIAVRAEHLHLAPVDHEPMKNRLTGTVTEVIFSGHAVHLRVESPAIGSIQYHGSRRAAARIDVGEVVELGWYPGDGVLVEEE